MHLKETRGGGVGEPEFRLRESRAMLRIGDKILKYFLHIASMVPGTILLPIGLLVAGWAAQQRVSWVVTDVVSVSQAVLFYLLN